MNGHEVAAIGILAGTIVALVLANIAQCLWSLRSKDKVIEPLSKGQSDLLDRLMAADWLNYIAASQDRANWIERRGPPSPEELAARGKAKEASAQQAADAPSPIAAFTGDGDAEPGPDEEGGIEEVVMTERV